MGAAFRMWKKSWTFLGNSPADSLTSTSYSRGMSNNALIGLGIIGILSTGSVAVVANTQSLVQQDSSTLLDASNVLLNQDETPAPETGLTVPTVESPTPVEEVLPADSATPQDAQVVQQAPAPTVEPEPVVTAPAPAPAPVDATSSGSSYSDDDEYDDDDDDDHDEDHDDDDDDDEDDHDDDDD